MATLVALGDLRGTDQPLKRPVYVRPIMKLDMTQHVPRERFPDDMLPADMMLHAVKMMREGDDSQPAAAPDVRVFI
jgi:hypothetical protein